MPTPIGVSGRFTAHARVDPASALATEAARIDYIGDHLRRAARAPLVASGGELIFEAVSATLEGFDVCAAFAPKVLETLRDDAEHSRMLIAPDAHCALQFVAWPGCHQEVFARRYGVYLQNLVGLINLLEQRGQSVAAILQMDAYVRENIDPALPPASLDGALSIDVEFSYLPTVRLLKGDYPLLPRTVLINADLCTPEELAQFPFSAG